MKKLAPQARTVCKLPMTRPAMPNRLYRFVNVQSSWPSLAKPKSIDAYGKQEECSPNRWRKDKCILNFWYTSHDHVGIDLKQSQRNCYRYIVVKNTARWIECVVVYIRKSTLVVDVLRFPVQAQPRCKAHNLRRANNTDTFDCELLCGTVSMLKRVTHSFSIHAKLCHAMQCKCPKSPRYNITTPIPLPSPLISFFLLTPPLIGFAI